MSVTSRWSAMPRTSLSSSASVAAGGGGGALSIGAWFASAKRVAPADTRTTAGMKR